MGRLFAISIFWVLLFTSRARAGNTVVVDLVPVVGAVSYKVEIKNFLHQLEPAHELQTAAPLVELDLEAGRYILRARSIDAFGGAGPWSEWFDFTVSSRAEAADDRTADREESREVETHRRFEIGLGEIETPSDDLDAHEIEIVSPTPPKRLRLRTRDDHFTADLKPGMYRIRVRTLFKSGGRTSWSESRELRVSPAPPRKLEPMSSSDLSPRAPIKSEIIFRWKPARGIEAVRLRVYDENGIVIHDLLTHETSTRIVLANDHRYEWTLANEIENSADASDKSESARSSFTVGNYIRIGVTPAEAPPSFFAWYRQIFSTIKFTTSNSDNDANVAQRLFASTGEIAFGKWNPANGFGYLGAASFSAIATDEDQLTYGSASILAGQRWTFVSGTRLLVWGGAGYRETPTVVAVRIPELSYFYNRISAIGPEFRISYLGSFSDSLGWHLFLNAYGGVAGVHTPTDRDFLAQDSISYGAQGAWRFSPTYTAYAGYTYQRDHAAYRGNPRPDNSSTLAGHYFGVTLQADLERAFGR